ncbi:MAG: hypothetical protein WCJ72_11845 [Chryseobacterium sp.]
MKNCILSLMSDYKTSDNILAFIKSIKNTYTANEIDLIILYKNIPDNVICEAREAYPEVILEDYSIYFEKFNIQKDLSVYHAKYLIIFFYFKEILNRKYNFILLSDINDVLIQGDIFKQPGLNDINFFAETQDLGQSRINLNKYKSCYSNETTSKNIFSKVINNGVILAKHNYILNYLELYTKELLSKIKNCKASNADQAILTHCVHNYFNTWENVTVHNSPNKLCAHLSQPHRMGILDKSISFSNKKINYLGLTPCIIHQYNRSENLTKFIFNQFGLTYKKPKLSALISDRSKRILARLKKELLRS